MCSYASLLLECATSFEPLSALGAFTESLLTLLACRKWPEFPIRFSSRIKL